MEAYMNTDMEEIHRQFFRYAHSVILGVLLLGTASSFINKTSFYPGFRFNIQLIIIFIFVELYIVLMKYHGQGTNRIIYKRFFLFYDLFFLSLWFVILVKTIEKSWDKNYEYLIPQALIIFIVLFILIISRQCIIIWFAKKNKLQIEKKDLIVSIIADGFGIVICGIAFFVPNWISPLSYIGIISFGIYFIFVRLVHFDKNSLKELIKSFTIQ